MKRIFFLGIQILIVCVVPVSAAFCEDTLYLRAGIPAATREWTGGDYARTLQVISSGVAPLPYFSDKQGAELLNRIMAMENFSFHRNRSVPIQVRLEDFLKQYQSVNSLMKIYYSKSPNGRQQHAELSRLLAYSLHTAAEGMALVDEFLPTIHKDGQYATRMDGLRQMKSGLTTAFVGAELTLTEDNGFTNEDRSAVLGAMASTLPKLNSVFTPEYRSELRRKLQADSLKFKNATDIAKINSMIRDLGG